MHVPDPELISRADGTSPEDSVLLAESVGLALRGGRQAGPGGAAGFRRLRHMFDLPFDEIAPVAGGDTGGGQAAGQPGPAAS